LSSDIIQEIERASIQACPKRNALGKHAINDRNARLDLFRGKRFPLLQAISGQEKAAAGREVVVVHLYPARSRNDFDGRPPATDSCCESEAVHGTRHLDISENDRYVEPVFEDGDGFVGVGCFGDIKTQGADPQRPCGSGTRLRRSA
jgi:hypothetical protein